MKKCKWYFVAFGLILLAFIGIIILIWYTKESALLDTLDVESVMIMDASICDANDCMNTEVKLDSEQIETVMQLFSRTKIKKIHARSAIQNSYARFFFETENRERREIIFAPDEILINRLDNQKGSIYRIVFPDNELELLVKELLDQ